MATTTAVSSQTAAATSSLITVAAGSAIKVWVDVALADGETVDITQHNDGDTASSALIESGDDGRPAVAQLQPGVTALMIIGPGYYKVSKSVTAVATAVYYDS